MKNRILVITGIILGFIPVYTVLGWIFIFIHYPENSHIEKQSVYAKKILFGINSLDNQLFHLLTLFFGFVSVFIFGVLLHRFSQIENKQLSEKVYLTVCFTLFIIFSLVTLLNTWYIL